MARLYGLIDTWNLLHGKFHAIAERLYSPRKLSDLTAKERLADKYDSAYKIDAIEAGSLGDYKDVYEEYKRLKRNLKQSINRMPSYMRDTEFVKDMEASIPEARDVTDMESAAKAVALLHRYSKSPFATTRGMKQYQKDILHEAQSQNMYLFSQEFTDKYGNLNSENMAKFMDFMKVQHTKHIGDYYGSERLVEFIKVIGEETWRRLGEQKAIEAFYLYAEQTEEIQRLEKGF